MVGDDAHPFHKVGAQLKRLVFPPQHDAHFLKNFFRVGRAAQQRYKVGKQPAIVLGEEPCEGVATLGIARFRIHRLPTTIISAFNAAHCPQDWEPHHRLGIEWPIW